MRKAGAGLVFALCWAIGLAVFALASGAYAAPAKRTVQLRCHMEECVVSTFNLVTRLSKSDEAEFFRVFSTATTTYHRDGNYDRKGKVIDTSSHVFYVNCSREIPAYIGEIEENGVTPEVGKYELVLLAPFYPTSVSGAKENAYRVYYAICHKIDDPFVGGEKLQQKYGYGEKLVEAAGNVFTIDTIDQFLNPSVSAAENSGPFDSPKSFFNGRWTAVGADVSCDDPNNQEGVVGFSETFLRANEEMCRFIGREDKGETRTTMVGFCFDEGATSVRERVFDKVSDDEVKLDGVAYKRCPASAKP